MLKQLNAFYNFDFLNVNSSIIACITGYPRVIEYFFNDVINKLYNGAGINRSNSWEKIAKNSKNSYKIKVSGPGTLKNGLPAPSFPYMRHAAARGKIHLIIAGQDGGGGGYF